eukprot:gnl/MRDRNA2_/MRDRNA2_112711_c0_seq1.p1 gnl/MRDRNA2_/MRDRNA2_112711_c0~~gnl/MRDRNA2_/MRDRNA2_112711_c0_seq1.p1  ORF type:complete len:159 (+),score=37.07 gnl/MRDRNA2_/MRDRNA2_112711_c0_seq1:86-562(+)
MTNPTRTVTEPMLQEVVDRSSQRSGKVLILLSVLLGIAAILSLPQVQSGEESATTMAFAPQPIRSRVPSFFGAPLVRPVVPIAPMQQGQVRASAVVDDMFPSDEILDNRVEQKAIKWVMHKRPKKRSPSQKRRVAPPPVDYGPPPPMVEVISEPKPQA